MEAVSVEMTDPRFKLGNVSGMDISTYESYKSPFVGFSAWEYDPECKDCRFLPLCKGGCRYMALVKYGDWRKKLCRKEYFEKGEMEIFRVIHDKPVEEYITAKNFDKKGE